MRHSIRCCHKHIPESEQKSLKSTQTITTANRLNMTKRWSLVSVLCGFRSDDHGGLQRMRDSPLCARPPLMHSKWICKSHCETKPNMNRMDKLALGEYMNSLQRFIRRSETMYSAMCTYACFGLQMLVKSTFQVVSLIRPPQGGWTALRNRVVENGRDPNEARHKWR